MYIQNLIKNKKEKNEIYKKFKNIIQFKLIICMSFVLFIKIFI